MTMVKHARGSVLDVAGSVTWEWLATCRECGRVHGYRTATPGLSYMTWAAADGHTYRPRMHRGELDALMIEHRMTDTSDGGAV
jgi:hypothetical protein